MNFFKQYFCKKELLAKASHFWIEHKWLGIGQFVRGVVMDGEPVILDDVHNRDVYGETIRNVRRIEKACP